MRFWFFRLALSALILSAVLRAESADVTVDADEKNEAVPVEEVLPEGTLPAEIEALVEPTAKPLKQNPDVFLPSTRFGFRLEPGLSVGAPTAQGFSLLGARAVVNGDFDSSWSYRFAVGQSKEFTTVLLPQLLPTEAFVYWRPSNEEDLKPLGVRVGMFIPALHPLWNTDLTDLDIIDYSTLHKETLLRNDIGVEMSWHDNSNQFTVIAGVVNGNGVLSINTNNTRAFTLYMRKFWGDSRHGVGLGAGGYSLSQSSRGSINYKAHSFGTLFIEGLAFDARLRWLFEYYAGQFNDSTRSLPVKGGAVTAWVGVLPQLRLMTQYEFTNASTLTGFRKEAWRLGPILDIHSNVKLFLAYDAVYNESSGTENQFLIRLRIAL